VSKELIKSLLIIALSTFVISFLLESFFVTNSKINKEISVVIHEGKTVKEINNLLTQNGVLRDGETLLNYNNIEGYLYPDTYRFYEGSTALVIKNKFLENFQNKAEPILKEDINNFDINLIIASIIEKEVPDYEDRKIVAGLIKKRLSINMLLQLDATLCYIKLYRDFSVDLEGESCYPITKSDKEIDSQYNTYLYKGLPPAPISNPGSEALQAVIEAKKSPYWFYLNDPKTGKTIFSRTLEEHNSNRYKYLN